MPRAGSGGGRASAPRRSSLVIAQLRRPPHQQPQFRQQPGRKRAQYRLPFQQFVVIPPQCTAPAIIWRHQNAAPAAISRPGNAAPAPIQRQDLPG